MSPGNHTRLLRDNMVGCQQDYISYLTNQIWMKNMDMYRENQCYVDNVLLPTIFIRIYQIFMELGSFKEAERRIFNKGASTHHLDDTL